jgi:hypothetical protein
MLLQQLLPGLAAVRGTDHPEGERHGQDIVVNMQP